jgi:hypothetical protein
MNHFLFTLETTFALMVMLGSLAFMGWFIADIVARWLNRKPRTKIDKDLSGAFNDGYKLPSWWQRVKRWLS